MDKIFSSYKMKSILLTFDIEEFDLPKEYGINISENEMSEISSEGTIKLLDLLKRYNIKATFFVTAYFALKNKSLIKQIKQEKHEIAFHGYLHSHDYKKMNKKDALYYLKKGKEQLEKIIKTKITGFRAPRMMPPEYSVIKECGFKYDSSSHPTHVPGRYNHFFRTRKITNKEGTILIPISVTPLIKLPFSWLWFRNFGLTYAKFCTLLALANKDFIDIYFHPWDFINIGKYELPFLIKNNTGNKCLKILEDYVVWCKKKKFVFKTIGNYLKLFK